MTTPRRSPLFPLVWVLVVLLAIVHQDLWWWDDRTLVLGFLPLGLGYHALFSIACAITWALAVRHAWPDRLEAWADATDADAPPGEGAAP